ncbi:MAG: hypothetical protein O9301_10280 [Leptospira sp.]|nr:hypothetical protein [Leptospira sp.]
MKTVLSILLIASLLVLSNCKDEERESRKRGQDQFLFSIAMAGFFRPNFCSAPQILLEEGIASNLTLEIGKPFYIDFKDRALVNGKRFKFNITIVKDSTTIVDFFSEDDCKTEGRPNPQAPISEQPTQVLIEAEAWGYGKDGVGKDTYGYYLILKSGVNNLNISYTQ